MEAYRRRYIEGHRIPPGIALSKGKAVHSAAEANFGQKMESFRDLPASDIVDLSVATFDQEIAVPEFDFTDDERDQGTDIVIGKARDSVADMAKIHAEAQAPDYQPILVEGEITIPLPDAPRDLLAKIDLIDDQHRVIDFKTAGKSKTQADADSSIQLTIYAAAHHAHYGSSPEDIRLDTIVQTKTKTTRNIVSTERSMVDFQPLANRINVVLHQIDAGIFAPTTPGAWWCGPKWCGYFSTCPYVNAERAAKAAE